MHSSTYIAALGALFSAVGAIPVKRELVVNTVTEIAVVTQVLTATVWVDAPEATPTLHVAQYSHGSHEHHTSAVLTSTTSTSTSTSVYVAPPPPTTSSSTSTSTSTYQAPPVYTAPPQPAPPMPTSVYVAPEPTTTSIYVAPTTSQYVAPVYTPPPPPPAPATTSTTAPAPVTTSTGSGGKQYSGDITYYAVGLGSCGETNSDSENVVAMAHGMMNKATMCGKTITISYQGVTQQAKVVDTCMSCVDGDLDLSPTLFKAIAPSGDGRVHGVSWSFN